MAKTPEEEKADFEAKVTAKKALEAEIRLKMEKKSKSIADIDEILVLLMILLGIT